MRPPRRSALAVLALAAMLGTACGRPGAFAPEPPPGPRSLEMTATAIAARGAAEQELAQLPDETIEEQMSGLEPAEFRQADRDGDGRLSRLEQLGLLREVWSGLMAIADAKGTSDPDGAAEAMADAPDTTAYHPGHDLNFTPTQAEVFIDANEIMPAVFQTLAGATRTIRMDLYLLGGKQGQKIADLLVKKHQEGVDVRILHDPNFGMAGDAKAQILPVIRSLQSQGVLVKPYPLSYMPHRRGLVLANRFQIDHDKWLVVDGETAMVGSMNLIDIGVMNHDVWMRLVGGGVPHELAAIHDATWQLRTGAAPDMRRDPAPPTRTLLGLDPLPGPMDATARLIKTDIDQQSAKGALLDAIATAKKSVHVGIYEFGDVDIANALVEAYKRGLDVRAMCDPNASYAKYLPLFKVVKLHGTPNLVTANILREAGVPVKWYVPQVEGQEHHMKMCVIDGERTIIGSTNFTYQAFKTFRETSVDVKCVPVAQRLEAMLQRDWETRGRPVIKPTFFEREIMASVKAMDRFSLSWW